MISTISTPRSRLDLGVFADRLYEELSTCKSVRSVPRPPDVIEFDSRKYYDHTINFQKALILAADGKPIPAFPVVLSDLSPLLKKELDQFLDAVGLESVLRMAVLRIFQDIDDEYNEVFPEDDPISKRFRINLCKEIAKILRVRLVQ